MAISISYPSSISEHASDDPPRSQDASHSPLNATHYASYRDVTQTLASETPPLSSRIARRDRAVDRNNDEALRHTGIDSELADISYDARWPLSPPELPPVAFNLEIAILTFTAKYIREARLCVPGDRYSGEANGLHKEPLNSGTSSDDLRDATLPIPPTLVPSAIGMVNQSLKGLAEFRPTTTNTRRRRLRPMNGDAVMKARLYSATSKCVFTSDPRMLMARSSTSRLPALGQERLSAVSEVASEKLHYLQL